MIEYTDSLDGVGPEHLDGFFVGWPSPPSAEKHLAFLHGSSHVELARDGDRVVGYCSAISDGVLSAYLSSLEVLPEFQGRGIGSELTRRLLARLGDLYMVDLVCDADLEPFYRRFGMIVFDRGMGLRRREALA